MYAKKRDSYKYEQRYVESEYDPGYNRYLLNPKQKHSVWKFASLPEVVAKSCGCKTAKDARKKFGKLDFASLVADFALKNASSVFQLTAISDDVGKTTVEVRDKSAATPKKVFHVPRKDYDDIYILNGRQIYFYSSKVRDIEGKRTPAKPLTNLWTDIPWNGISNEGSVKFKNGKKPERLIKRCFEIASSEGDR
jgi:adenine-specific DNA-methyltransferase